MARGSSDVFGGRGDELSAPQMYERGVNGTFGEPGCIRDCAHAGADRSPFVSRSLTVEMQVNHERGRLLIVPD